MLTNPVEILGDDNGWVKGIRCLRMELGKPDASGRKSPIEIPGSEFDMEADVVIMSLGTSPNPLISATTPGLASNKWQCLIADESGQTTREGVFAGGDAVTGAATVILAMIPFLRSYRISLSFNCNVYTSRLCQVIKGFDCNTVTMNVRPYRYCA